MAAILSSSTRAKSPSKVFVKFLTEIRNELFGSYRPEKHYMRGPHPKRGSAAGKAETLNEQGSDSGLR